MADNTMSNSYWAYWPAAEAAEVGPAPHYIFLNLWDFGHFVRSSTAEELDVVETVTLIDWLKPNTDSADITSHLFYLKRLPNLESFTFENQPSFAHAQLNIGNYRSFTYRVQDLLCKAIRPFARDSDAHEEKLVLKFRFGTNYDNAYADQAIVPEGGNDNQIRALAKKEAEKMDQRFTAFMEHLIRITQRARDAEAAQVLTVLATQS